MNRKQRIALWVGLINFAVLLMFPPFDVCSSLDEKSLVFAGFQFFFARDAHEVVNRDLLFLECVVLLVNVGIAWLLLRDVGHMFGSLRHLNFQNAILLMVASNLTLILLFPPFEYFYALSNAVLPSFQGFYFVFSAGPMMTIVAPILYLEVVFVLFNGAVLWLLFRRGREKALTPEETLSLLSEIRKSR